MNQIKLKLIIAVSIMMFISCSNSQVQTDKLHEQLVILDLQAWINLMPGGPGSFHLTGEYEFHKTESSKLLLIGIEVYSANQMIYKIKSSDFNNELQKDVNVKKQKYRFNIQPGLKLNEKIRTAEMIDVKLIYNFDGISIEKTNTDIYITRAY